VSCRKYHYCDFPDQDLEGQQAFLQSMQRPSPSESETGIGDGDTLSTPTEPSYPDPLPLPSSSSTYRTARSSDITHRYHTPLQNGSSEAAGGYEYIYLLANPSAGYNFRVVEIGPSDYDRGGQLRDALRERYNACRSNWCRFLYGQPTAIGYYQVL